jgi:hypothetical protein
VKNVIILEMMKNENIKLFLTSFFQVMLVAINVICISKGLILFMLITSFFLSLMWSFNVSKVAICTILDRIIYSTGAMCGTLIGYLISKLL